MKKNLFILLALLLAVTQGAWATPSVAVNGKLPGAFSVSPTKVVYFSQGNLMYTKSTGKWKIMDHQYDVVETLNQNVGTDYADQDVVTLFGWGTSGWNNTAADATSVHYQPYATCNTNHFTANNNYQYGPSLANVADGESWSKEVAGNHPYENYDWGVFNSGDLGAGWRTLTSTEWGYLFNTRTPGNSVNGVSNARYTEATINTDGTAVNGIILFPDDAVLTTVSGVTWGTINSSSAWGTQCTSAGWTALETAGCVFLPAAGYRNGTSVYGVGSSGGYWSSSANSATLAYYLYFSSGGVAPQNLRNRYGGYSVRLVSDEAPPAMTETPLTFEAMVAGAQVTYSSFGSKPVEYKINDEEWTNYDANTSISLNVGDKVSFRGNNTSYSSFSNSCVFSCSKDCYIYGNIMSLISSTGYATATTLSAASTFRYMFYNNTHIKNHPSKALVLPATTLTNVCYQYMFRGCTGLTSAPALPATALAESSYYGMFNGCTSLATPPTLPATTLANSCCREMFSGCTNLVTAPALPATTLASLCYTDMFYNCTSLTSAPELPATTLASNCYGGMFQRCTGLTSAPELPATTLAYGCYGNMFEGCTGLIDAPELPATTLANNCYEYMFSGCTNLETAPELPATTLAEECYYAMFEGCTGLTSAPALPATTLTPYCYIEMFNGCTNLSSVTCYATARSSDDDSYFWLNGVAENGTFYAPKNSVFASDAPGASSIPEGWVFTPPFQASISSTPTAIEDLVYTGSAQELVNAGTAEGGTMYYSLDNSSWSTSIPTATDVDDYTVYYKVVGDATHADIDAASLNVTIAAPAAVIGDPNNADQITAFLNYYNGQNVAALTIKRPVLNNMYNTLCLPFDMNAAQIAASSLNGFEIYELEDVSVENDELFLGLSDPKNAIVAGRPYIVKYSAASQLDDLDFENVTINNADLNEGAVTIKGVTFTGTFQPVVLGAQTELDFNGGHLFLGQNNQLFWPNTNNPVKPFRAYFTVNVDAGQAAGMPVRRGMPARIGRPASTPAGVENVQGTEINAKKVIRDGQLIIMRNGVEYNANGQAIK